MSDYQKRRELSRSARAVVWSAVRASDGAEVVLKIPCAHGEAAVAWEHDILSRIDSPAVAKPLGIAHENGEHALVLAPHTGKERLSSRAPLSVKDLLDLALGVTEALAEVHEAAIVHASLSLDNVLVGADPSAISLTGFGAARPIFARAIDPKIAGISTAPIGTFAPELDSAEDGVLASDRADLYALGVMLYQLSTGIFPAKLARTPPAPKALKRELPQSLSEIVIRLLARDPALRYTSALGVAADLASARELFLKADLSARFELDRRGRAMQLSVAGGLIGRTEASRRVLECFAASLGGEKRAVSLEGPSGIGKTSLVEHLRPKLEASGSHLAVGKFDHLHRSRVYGALSDALLRASETLLVKERAPLLKERLGDSLGWILRAIPELAQMLGGEPASAAASDAEIRARIASAIVRYAGALGELAGPLAFFLDDLQWADPATMEVLPHLLAESDPRRVFFLLAWRSEDVDAAHPLSLMRHDVSRLGVLVEHIRINPLGPSETHTLLEAALERSTMPPELAELVHDRTGGNPFLVRQLLDALVRDRAITRDDDRGTWCCELESAKTLLVADRTDSVVARRIQLLGPRTKKALAVGAMIGPVISLSDLARVASISEARAELDLAPAVRDGLLVIVAGKTPLYHFVHDRVEAAARAGLDADEGVVHAEVAHRLSPGWRAADDARLHWLAAQARAGRTHLEPGGESNELFELLLAAARSARASASFATAVADLEAALDLMAGDNAPDSRAVEQRATLELAECAVANGDFDRADRAARRLEQLAANPEDRARARLIDTQMHLLRHNHDGAVDSALAGLAMLGVALSRRPPRWKVAAALIGTELAIKRRSVKKIEALPGMNAERPRLALGLLSAAMAAVYQIGDRDLFAMCALSAVRLSLEHGHADGTGFAMVVYGMLRIIALQDLEGGRRYGRLGLRISAQHDSPGTQCRSHVVHQQFVHPWTEDQPVRVEDVLRAHALGRDAGELTYAGYAFGSLLTSFSKGPPLSEIHALTALGAVFTARTGDVGATEFTRALGKHYDRLINAPAADAVVENIAEEQYVRLGNAWRLWWQGHRSFVATIENDGASVDDAVAASRGLEDAGAASWMGFMLSFCAALRACAKHREGRATSAEKKALRRTRSFLKKWVRACPKMARGYRELVEGAWLEANGKKASLACYERASEAGRETEQHALAHLSARFAAAAHHRRGAAGLARAFEIIARDEARVWGAHAIADGYEQSAHEAAGRSVRESVAPAQSLLQLLQPLAKESSLAGLAELALKTAHELSRAESATLFLRAKDAWKTIAGNAVPSASLLSAALHSSEPRMIACSTDDDRSCARRSLVVPLWRAGEAIGALVLDGTSLDADAVSTLSALAAPIAVMLENAELRAEIINARDDARAAAQAKALLLANVSHELRTPLHGILGTLEHLDAVAMPDRAKELVGELGTAANALRRSLGALLEYVDAESGEHALEHVAFDLHRLIESTVAPHRIKAVEKRLTFELALDASLPRGVKGDPIRLGRVLDQILDNAVKFTDLGCVRLEARATFKDSGRAEVMFAVADTGSGMSEEQRARAFDTLRQHDSSSTKAHAGLGVGLAFVRRAMHVLQGSIAIASEHGAGTRVDLSLPIAVLTKRERGAPVEAPAESPVVLRDLVLVAEDNPVNQKLMARTLERLGFAHEVCEDGEVVTAAYRERSQRVLCVLMDCQMPKMDGYEASVQIRAFEEEQRLIRVPILAVTANAMAQDREKCLQAGMDDHLPKPVRSADLQAAFARWTRRSETFMG